MASASPVPPSPGQPREEQLRQIEAIVQALQSVGEASGTQLPKLTREQAYDLTKLQLELQRREQHESRLFAGALVTLCLVAFCVALGLLLGFNQPAALLELVKVVGTLAAGVIGGYGFARARGKDK
jgi:hypothetical protein